MTDKNNTNNNIHHHQSPPALDDSSSQMESPYRSMFADDDEDVTYFTEDGYEIPIEYQTSILMSLDLQEQLRQEKEKEKKSRHNNKKAENDDDNDDGNDDNRKPTRSSSAAADQQEPSVDIEQLFLDLERLTRETAQEILAEQKKQDDEETHDHDEEEEEEYNNIEKEGDFEATDQEHMIDGMIQSESALGMEREETDQSQWKLQEIIMRRSVPVQYTDPDVDFEDYEHSNAVGHSTVDKSKIKKEFSYLCRWQGYRDATWELRSVLVEDGFAPQVIEYDLKIKEKGIKEKQPRSTAYKAPSPYKSIQGKSDSAQIKQVFGVNGTGRKNEKNNNNNKSAEALVETIPVFRRPKISLRPLETHQVFLEQMLPNFMDRVKQSALDSNCVVRKIINIAPKEPAERFMETLRKNKVNTKMLFHGSPAVAKIMTNGLLVPGGDTGVTVRNGQAHSPQQNCIYTASAFGTSVHYCGGATPKRMFVCVGVDESYTYVNSSISIFASSDYVVPVFLVEFEVMPHFLHVKDAKARLSAANVIERFYCFNEFKDPLPSNKFDYEIEQLKKQEQKLLQEAQLAYSMASGYVSSTNNIVGIAKTTKEQKKARRTQRRVLNVRAGFAVEDA